MSAYLKLLIYSIILLIPHQVSSQTIAEERYILDTISIYDDFFLKEEPITLTLKFDIKAYQKTRISEAYQDAELIYQIDDSISITHKVKLKTRGEYRKKFCTIPPFWLNIKKSNIPSNDLDGIRKVKVVTHCKNSDRFSDYLMKEYLVYKLYNIISPYSFRVRLIRVIYVDTGRDNKITENWAFALEPEKLLAERLDARAIENDRLAMATVNCDVLDRLALFQYMIGNADYSITGRHNIKIIRLHGEGPIGNIPIPYDFDYTGIVNTSYATPGENLGLANVRERYFLGPCRDEAVHQKVVEELKGHKQELLDVLEQCELLSIRQKIYAVKYIESYFSEAEASKFIEWNLKSTCR